MTTPPEPIAPTARPQAASSGGYVVRLLGAAVVIAGLGVLGWYVYDRLLSTGGSGEVPLIEADDGPTKKRPEDPGGLVVPNQDKLVYETLDGEGAEETVERLLPAPEEPLPQPEPAELIPEPTRESTGEAPVAEPAPTAEQADIPPLPPAELGSETVPATAEISAAPPPEPVAEAPDPEPVAPAESESATAGVYLVQLAAFRESAEADKAWRQLAKQHGDLLSDFTARVERADLGADLGVFYRLRIGPFGGEAAAKALCDALKSRNLDCLVVRP
jgi:cell division protein FtsN